MRNIIKVISVVLIFIILIAFLGYIYGLIFIKNTYPEYNGEVITKNISQNISVKFDRFAHPEIQAANDVDAAYALGYVHASERLFQMDLMLRTGLGMLSEAFGDSTVAIDIFFRTIGIKDVAIKSYELLPYDYQKYLIAYTKGVNDYINSNNKKLSIEFNIFAYRPLKWKPYYPIIISKLVAWEMNLSWWSDIILTKMYLKMGEKAKYFILDENYGIANLKSDTTIIKSQQITSNIVEIDYKVRKILGFDAIHIGSNNWVISANKSATGKPILCNDPHLVLRNPNFFYFASIKTPTWNVKGYTIPGIPAVIVGTNNSIAWAITNLMLDDCDFYLENIDWQKNTYNVDGKDRNLFTSIDTIKMLKKNYIFTKYYTHRGPVISQLAKYNEFVAGFKGENIADLSIRWTGLIPSTEFKTLIDINKSRNFSDFKRSFTGYVSPGQNYVYADVTGNIGYIMAGKIPIRATNSTTIAFDGRVSANDWKGFVPDDQMPFLFNPPEGFIATANNKVIKSFNYHITNFWEPDSRIKRIEQLLKSKDKHSIEDCIIYQNDIISPYALELKDYILNAFNGYKIKDNNLKIALELLAAWDGSIDKDLQSPLIFHTFLNVFIEKTLKDDLGDGFYNEYVFLANMPLRLIQKLCRDGNSILFDNIETKNIEDRDFIIRESMAKAIELLTEEFGAELALWQWGKKHTISPRHLFELKNKFMSFVIKTPEYPVNGDGTTLFNTEYLFNSDFKAKISPAFKLIYDFSKNKMYVSVPGGQSGYLLSEQNLNQFENFINGKYTVVNFGNYNLGEIKFFKK
ncbi:MAG TPA: penicillin acylase family protein [Ignavibacteriales bacterium]|nr:penicillin acylase family protein [Ignavibacteriales bacterium]HOL81742.1 penicillin acylase family protein [Ignavibacteriales bacterium]HOM65699.1 penicillin acylase family protein [Ignavibacteriales bacterium]HPD67395.1 penicillin acylase family protein [Ignavibacteriales bacterium]HPP32920.1 penicillin acylase family protein [Ignavibacteriales bacterium]